MPSNIDSFLRLRQFGIQNTTAIDLEPFTRRNIASHRQLYQSNVLDRRYRTGGVNAFDSLGFSHATYGTARSFGGQIGYRFP